MDFTTVVRRRRMVRSYRTDPVDPEALERLVDHARRGPSAGFSQGQHLVIVTDRVTRERVAQLCGEPEHVERGFDPWLSRAPVHVVPCVRRGDYDSRYAQPDKAGSRGPEGWGVPFWWVDGGATLMLLLLGAVDEGLAAGFLAVDDTAGLRRVLAIPADVAPLGVVTIGHPAPEPRSRSAGRRRRRPAADVVHRERWS